MENSFYIEACLEPHSLSASLQVLEVAREMRDDPMVVRVAGGYVQNMGANRARNPSDMVPLIFTLVNFDVFEVLRHYANVLKGARKPSDLVPLSSLRQYTKSLYKVTYEVI